MSGRLVRPVDASDHARGSADAPVTLIEYGDFECPVCGAVFDSLARLRAGFGDRVRFVFRHFPLQQLHPNALNAAIAAEAAARQDAFWPMHDTLFTHQDALEPEDLLGYARDLGLDPDRFEADVEDASLQRRVRRDFRGGIRSGVNGTPCFFVNGERYDGPPGAEGLAAAIEEQLAAASR